MGALFGGVRSSKSAVLDGNMGSQTSFRVEKGLNHAPKAIYLQNEYLFMAFKAFHSVQMH